MADEKKFTVKVQAKTKQLTKQQYIGFLFRHLNSIAWTGELIASIKKAVLENRKGELRALMGDFGPDFVVEENDRLYYSMPQYGLKWVIVNQDKKDDVLRTLYQDPLTTANSRDGFYSHVSQRCIGITKAYVHKWLRNQESYQLHVKVPQPKNLNVIVTRYPNQLWFADITYFKRFKERNFKYILSVIDHFSKYAWAVPLKSLTASEVATAMANIWDGNIDGKKPTKPETIQTDNGKEFESEFDKLLKREKVKHTTGYSYAPQSQGAVESFNKTIKRKLVGYMTAVDSEKWVQVLPSIVENYNNTRHSMTRQTPEDLYWGKTEKAEEKQIVNRVLKRRHNNNIRAHASSTNNDREINVGDHVRVSKWSWNPDRDPKGEENFVKARKSGMASKKYYAGWTRAIFQVKQRLGKKGDLEKGIFGTVKYILADPNKPNEKGEPTTLTGRRFYRTDLLKVDLEKTVDVAGKKINVKKYTMEDMNKFVSDEKLERKRELAATVGETTQVDTTQRNWQHQHIVGMYVWNKGTYVGQIHMIANKKNAKGKYTKSAVIQKEDNSFKNYAINTLINRRSKQIVLTNTKNLTDVFDGSVTLKLNG